MTSASNMTMTIAARRRRFRRRSNESLLLLFVVSATATATATLAAAAATSAACSFQRRGHQAHHYSWHQQACFQTTTTTITPATRAPSSFYGSTRNGDHAPPRIAAAAAATTTPYCHDEKWQKRSRLLVMANSNSNDGVMENIESSSSSSNTKDARSALPLPSPPPPLPPKNKNKVNKKFRMQLFAALNLPTYEIASAGAVLTSSFLVAVNTLPNLPRTTTSLPTFSSSWYSLSDSSAILLDFDAYTAIRQMILILDVFFCIDFFCRWYAAGQFKLKYLTKPLAVIDIIVVIIPLVFGSLLGLLAMESSLLGGVGGGGVGMGMGDFLAQKTTMAAAGGDSVVSSALASLSTTTTDSAVAAAADAMVTTATTGWQSVDYYSAGLQNLLLLRILKLQRVLTDINTFARFAITLGLKPKDVRPYQLQLARALLSTYTLVSVASGLIYTAEHEVNPAMTDYFCALYFTLTTLTTVGLGDVVPVTALGRFFTSAMICVGVAVIPVQAAKLAEAFIAFQKDQDLAKRITIRAPPGAKNFRYKNVGSRSGSGSSSNNYSIKPTSGKGPSGIDVDDVVPEEKQFFIPDGKTKEMLDDKLGGGSRSSTTAITYGMAKIDGKGPEGIDIEFPVKDNEWSARGAAQTKTAQIAAATATSFSMTETTRTPSEVDRIDSGKMTTMSFPLKEWSPQTPSTTTISTATTTQASMTTSVFETSSSMVSSSSSNTRRSCDQCGAAPHRLDAFFCWSCGQKLP
jgi:Ion channel